MSGHHSFSKLRDQVLSRPGGAEAMAKARVETMNEIRLYELRRTEAMRQIAETGRLDITPDAVTDLERPEDVRISTLRDTSNRLARGSNSSQCSTTKTVACRCTSARNQRRAQVYRRLSRSASR